MSRGLKLAVTRTDEKIQTTRSGDHLSLLVAHEENERAVISPPPSGLQTRSSTLWLWFLALEALFALIYFPVRDPLGKPPSPRFPSVDGVAGAGARLGAARARQRSPRSPTESGAIARTRRSPGGSLAPACFFSSRVTRPTSSGTRSWARTTSRSRRSSTRSTSRCTRCSPSGCCCSPARGFPAVTERAFSTR